MVQPAVVDVAVNTFVVALVSFPVVGTDRESHLPATSARLMGAGAVVVVVVEVVEDAVVLVVSTAALSFLAHPARTAAEQQMAMRVVRCNVNMEPPGCENGGRLLTRTKAEPSERKASQSLWQETPATD